MDDYFFLRDQLAPVIEAIGEDGCEGGEYISGLVDLALRGMGGGYSSDGAFALRMLQQAAIEAMSNLAHAITDPDNSVVSFDEIVDNLRALIPNTENRND